MQIFLTILSCFLTVRDKSMLLISRQQLFPEMTLLLYQLQLQLACFKRLTGEGILDIPLIG